VCAASSSREVAQRSAVSARAHIHTTLRALRAARSSVRFSPAPRFQHLIASPFNASMNFLHKGIVAFRIYFF
jgi:hypothetical protein